MLCKQPFGVAFVDRSRLHALSAIPTRIIATTTFVFATDDIAFYESRYYAF